MKISFIIFSFVLVTSQFKTDSYVFDNVPASTGSVELSNSHEEPKINNDEDEENHKRKKLAFLILLKNSNENEKSLEEESNEAEKQIRHGQKSKRCMALNLLRKSRLISMPKYAQKNLSASTESSINDSEENTNDAKSYFRLASKKDTNDILKSLSRSRSPIREDDDPIVSLSQDQNPIVLLGQDFNKLDNERPKKYVCYCIDDNCGTENPMKPSRPYAMRKTIGPNILGSRYSTNEENQRISDLTALDQEDLANSGNLHCPPGTVLVEESDYSEYSNRKQYSHKRRPVKKCPPIIMPCESEAQSIGQPMRIAIPLAGNRNLNRCAYKVDRRLPFVQKLQSLIERNYPHGEVQYPEEGSSHDGGSGVQDYYYNTEQGFDHHEQVPMARNFARPRTYDFHPRYSQYPQYSDSLVGDSRIPLKPIDQPYKGHQEPSYKAVTLGKHFLDIEECIKTFGSAFCTVSTTPISSGKKPEVTEKYEEPQESIVGSQPDEEIRHSTAGLPSRKITKLKYPTTVNDDDKIVKSDDFQEMKAHKADRKDDEKNLSNTDRYPESGASTKFGEYFSGRPINKKIQQSYNVPEIITSNYEIVSSTGEKQNNIGDNGNFLGQNSLIHSDSDRKNIDYSVSTENSEQSGTEDYYDVTEEAREGAVRKKPSLGRVSKFPQPQSTSVTSAWQRAQSASSPRYRQYTIRPTGQDVEPSSSEDTSEVTAGYVSAPHDSKSPKHWTSEDQSSKNDFRSEDDRNEDKATKYYTTRPSDRVGVTKKHSVHVPVNDDDYDDDDERRQKSSTKSPNTVFMKMEEPWINYRTTIPTENLNRNRFQGSQRITTVYPVIDDENDEFSASPSTQSSNNRNNEDDVFSSSNLHYSIQPEENPANFASVIATNVAAPRPSVGTIQSTPINNYSKTDSVSGGAYRSGNRYSASRVAMKNSAYDTTPSLRLNNAVQRKLTTTSYPVSNNFEANTVSSWPEEIRQTNSEDDSDEPSSTPHYTAQLGVTGIDNYSTMLKSSHPQSIGSHQLTDDGQTTEKFNTQFYVSPTTEAIISTKKSADHLRKPVGRPRHEDTTFNIKNLRSEDIGRSNEYPFDTYPSKKVTGHHSRLPSRNWDYTTQSGKKVTFVDEEASTADRAPQRQFVGSYQSFADGITPTSRSDFFNRYTTRLGNMHAPTTASRLHKSSQKSSKILSDSLYPSQSEKPLFLMNHRTNMQPEDLELGLSDADDYSTEDMTNTYTPTESIFEESSAETERRLSEKNREDKPRHPSKESHQLITTPSKYGNDYEIKRPSVDSLKPKKMTSRVENNSDIKKEFNESFLPNSFDDKVEEVTEPDSYYEEMDSKNRNDFGSTSSDDSTVTDSNESEDINSSTVVDEEVGATNRPKAPKTESTNINNSKHYTTNHSAAVEESSQTDNTSNDKVVVETPSYKEDDDDFSSTLQISNEDAPQYNPDENYEEKDTTTSYYESVSPQSKDRITRIRTKGEFKSSTDASYSASPISATHYFRNPSTSSDIVKSENFVHDKYSTKGHRNNHSRTNQSNDRSSLQKSQETGLSPYPVKPSSASPTAGNPLSSQSFADSEDFRSTIKQVPSSIPNKKESVGKPLRADSKATTGKADPSKSISSAKSASNYQEKKYDGLNSMNKIVLQPTYTEVQKTLANDYAEDIVNDDGTSDEDQSYLKNAVQKVVDDLISRESNNAYKNTPNAPDTVATSDHELSSGLPVLKNLFAVPEVKDMVIDTVKSEVLEDISDISLDQLKDNEIESALRGVINNLLLEKSATLSSSMTVDEHQYKNSHRIVTASVASIERTVGRKTSDEITNSIQNIIQRPEIGLQGARLPVVQNIIVRTVENALRKAKKVVDHSLIWNALNNIIADAENAAISSYEDLPTLRPPPYVPNKKPSSDSLKNIPVIPVIERVFKDGQWFDKKTVLGKKKKPFDSKLSSSRTVTSSDDSGFRAPYSSYETSMINTNNFEATTNAPDYGLLGDSEEAEDEDTDQEVVKVTSHVPICNVNKSVGAKSGKQKINNEEDHEKAPIKYYSPSDRILTYIKNHQNLEGKMHTTLHSLDSDESSKYHRPTPDARSNGFSTSESLEEPQRETASDGDEVFVDRRPFTTKLVESTESEESGERITTSTPRYKFAKIPKYYDLSEEATTLTPDSVGAAKSRGENQYLQEDMKNPENVEASKSDPAYFGKLSLNGSNPSGDGICELANKDLFYIGDGVKIPLTIRRMPDGSYALSISEKICEKFENRRCPCCVPKEGEIVEESRRSDVADEYEATESSGYDSQTKRRYARSTSGSDIVTTNTSPVKSFVKKYNITLNLETARTPQQSLATEEKKIEEIKNTVRNKRLGSFRDTKIMNFFDKDNQIRRDDSEEEARNVDDNSQAISKSSNSIRYEFNDDKETNTFIDNLLHIEDVPEYKRTEVVVNALDGLINSATAKNLSPTGHQNIIEFIDDDSAEDQNQWEEWEDSSVYDLRDVENKNLGYGYQKDNPILERIKIIKENQSGRGQYKYQQNIDHHAREKMNVLKTVLRWLRKVFLQARVNDKN